MNARASVLLVAPLFCSFSAAQATPEAAGKTQTALTNKFGAVQIAGVSVKGLAPNDAKRRLARVLKNKLQTRVKLSDGKRAVYRKRADLGVQINLDAMLQAARNGQKSVPLKLKSDPRDMQLALRHMALRFNFAGRDARLVETKTGVQILKEQSSRKLDVTTSAYQASAQIVKNPAVRVLVLKSNTFPHKLTVARFKGINARIGSFQTDFNGAKIKRTLNMKIAIKAIDGTFVPAGKIFSLNQTVGERTQARGYRTSIIFLNGYKVPGVGAGVSQVTGTLFNAALLAGLPIAEVRFHSRPVAYLPIGRDATVAWGGFDMKFKNNTPAPIYIKYTISKSSVRAVLFGHKTPGQTVSLTVRKQQKNAREIHAQLYRTIRRNGKAVKQMIRNHTYKWNKGAWEE